MARIQSPDPFVTEKEPVAESFDMGDHLRTYNGFLSLTKWAIIHMAVIMVALYCFIIAKNSALGFFFFFVPVCILIFGITRRPAIRRDMANAAAGVGDDR